MTQHSADEIAHHVKIYLRVFGALLALTVATVTASYLNLPLGIAIGVALLIATVKSGLVAAFFMHLRWERRIIFAVLVLAALFFALLLITPSIGHI